VVGKLCLSEEKGENGCPSRRKAFFLLLTREGWGTSCNIRGVVKKEKPKKKLGSAKDRGGPFAM